MSLEENKPKRQRALVLQGGGALGAYEIGVLKVLSKKLKLKATMHILIHIHKIIS